MTLTNAARRAREYGFPTLLRRRGWKAGKGLEVRPDEPTDLYAATLDDLCAGDWQVCETEADRA